MSRWLVASLALLLAACAQKPELAEQALTVAANCDAAAASCEARSGDRTLALSLSAPKAMQPFEVHARWQGVAESVLVNFEMAGMDMGENRYRLVADGQGGWSGKAVLPVCVTGRSDWIADVQVTDKDGVVYRARMPFTVAR